MYKFEVLLLHLHQPYLLQELFLMDHLIHLLLLLQQKLF
jgi:hypothetical protein